MITSFGIRTQNPRDNKHINAISAVLERHGVQGRFRYVGADFNEGAAIYGEFPEAVVAEIQSLPIPKSAKIGW